MRGEYTRRDCQRTLKRGSPPLARGVLSECAFLVLAQRITPACAGSTQLRQLDPTSSRDHPRLRGEYLHFFQRSLRNLGSPPLARGVRSLSKGVIHGSRITPACAGSTDAISIARQSKKDHPRLRGEYKNNFPPTITEAGSPPLARGVQLLKLCAQMQSGITPACAGSTITPHSVTVITWDHPRLRGEYYR